MCSMNHTSIPVASGLFLGNMQIEGSEGSSTMQSYINAIVQRTRTRSGLSTLSLTGTNWYCVLVLLGCLVAGLHWNASHHDGIPVVNRKFAWEPRVFARLRWAINSVAILDDAHRRYEGQPYRLARGDVDVLVLPAHLLPELNKRDETFLNSHKYQCHSITGHLNELEVVLKSNFHMKVMLNRGTTALPSMVKPLGERARAGISKQFPTSRAVWTDVDPLPRIAQCISQLAAFMLLGDPICDDPALIELSPRLTQKAFTVAFAMRLVPRFLVPVLLPLLPPKWDLGNTWRALDKIVVPELERRKREDIHSGAGNVASWMMCDAKSDQDADPAVITRLIGSAFAGGIWSTSTLIFGVIVDLAAHPAYLAEIRAEIQQTHAEVQGQWTSAALNGLAKLDSAMKESSRRAPGSLLVYGRVVEQDIYLSNGLSLKKGQHIATPLHSHHSDPELVPDPSVYDPLRWYRRDPESHRKQPFTSLNEIGRWGSGRRACPGRFLASTCAKIMLVMLLDGYDFELIDGQHHSVSNMHEFVFIHPSTKIKMRERSDRLDFQFV